MANLHWSISSYLNCFSGEVSVFYPPLPPVELILIDFVLFSRTPEVSMGSPISSFDVFSPSGSVFGPTFFWFLTGFFDYALNFFIVSGFISGLYELASSFSVVEVCFGMFNSLVFFGGVCGFFWRFWYFRGRVISC